MFDLALMLDPSATTCRPKPRAMPVIAAMMGLLAADSGHGLAETTVDLRAADRKPLRSMRRRITEFTEIDDRDPDARPPACTLPRTATRPASSESFRRSSRSELAASSRWCDAPSPVSTIFAMLRNPGETGLIYSQLAEADPASHNCA